MYILDTNVLRAIFGQKGSHPSLESRILQTPFEQIFISVVSAEEILRGTIELFRRYEKDQKLAQAYAFVENLLTDLAAYQMLSFTNNDAQRYLAMSPDVRRTGKGDCRIAASAIERGYTIITRNVVDFKTIGARCENWIDA